MADKPDEKHIPMQHQADYNPPLEFNDSGYRIRGGLVNPNIGLFLGCSGPGPEIVHFPAGPKGTNLDLAALPVRYSPFVPPGKAVLFDGETIKVFDLPQPEQEEKEKE